MKIKHLFIILHLGILFTSCKQEKKTIKTSLHNFMIGNWETTYIKIIYPTDSIPVIFEEKFDKPTTGRAQSEYKNDGTFKAWFKQPDGKIVGETNGHWKTKNDSLYLNYSYSGKEIKAWYLIKIKTPNFEGKVIYDWNNDGEFNDTLLMKAKKIKL